MSEILVSEDPDPQPRGEWSFSPINIEDGIPPSPEVQRAGVRMLSRTADTILVDRGHRPGNDDNLRIVENSASLRRISQSVKTAEGKTRVFTMYFYVEYDEAGEMLCGRSWSADSLVISSSLEPGVTDDPLAAQQRIAARFPSPETTVSIPSQRGPIGSFVTRLLGKVSL